MLLGSPSLSKRSPSRGSFVQTLSGRITVAQESRFRLVDDAGVSHLFVVSHRVPIDPYALARLATHQRRVTVRYAEAAALVARVAHDIAVDGNFNEERA